MPSLKRILSFSRFLYIQRTGKLSVPDEPHFDPESVPAFYALLKPAKRYLEFGTGGSTMVAARMGIDTISVDNDRFFAQSVQRHLPKDAPNRMLPIYIGFTREWGLPLFRKPTPERIARWRRYIDAPFEVLAENPGPFPNLILVDGRFRRACALESARQAQLAGQKTVIFVDDYVRRPTYRDVEQLLGTPRMAGRAAIFEIGPDTKTVPKSKVDEAIMDCR